MRTEAAAAEALHIGTLRIAPALMLAPMEGVTDRCFRGLIIETNGPGTVGAACTEFLRVTEHALPFARIRAEIADHRWPEVAIGVQIMGNRETAVAESAVVAAEAGAAYVDLNFGCPAPRVFQHCAGSALLADPPRLARLVRATVDACAGRLPVTAKIRAGIESDSGLVEIARRIADAGAAALTVHARLRTDSYEDPARWERIARAKAAVRIPVIGNGGADSPAAIVRMRAETGCDAVMVGRGALADPWIFRALAALHAGNRHPPPSAAARLQWVRAYAARMEEGGATPLQALGRAKQALKAAARAGHLPSAAVRAALRSPRLEEALALAAESAA